MRRRNLRCPSATLLPPQERLARSCLRCRRHSVPVCGWGAGDLCSQHQRADIYGVIREDRQQQTVQPDRYRHAVPIHLPPQQPPRLLRHPRNRLEFSQLLSVPSSHLTTPLLCLCIPLPLTMYPHACCFYPFVLCSLFHLPP